jgi:prevent-host-death family protein
VITNLLGVVYLIQIRPVSDLRNKFPEIEDIVVKEGQPVFLTKNGYGSMVVLSLEKYAELTDDVELKLDEADKQAESTNVRYSHDEVSSRVRARINTER